MNRKRLLSASIVLIVLANLIVWGYVLFKKQNLRKASAQNSNRCIIHQKIKLPYFDIGNDNGTLITPDILDAKLNILIFFTLADCPSCLYEAEFWSEASQIFHKSDVSFWGVTTGGDRINIQEFLQEYRISFPIIFDKKDSLKEKILSKDEISRMNITTPFKIFVNRNHEIVHIEGSRKDAEQQRLFPVRISQILLELKKKERGNT
jgi:peroxiredoxin